MKAIGLTQGKEALVDDGMYEELNKYKWRARCSCGRWYANRWSSMVNGERYLIHMHRVVLLTPEGMATDHINGDGLDNRRENLRLATNSENNQNRINKRRRCTSNFKGVYWHNETKKWSSGIRLAGKQIYLGEFISEIQAALAYDEASKKYFGEFARTNFIDV
jgi:hypothetical protein